MQTKFTAEGRLIIDFYITEHGYGEDIIPKNDEEFLQAVKEYFYETLEEVANINKIDIENFQYNIEDIPLTEEGGEDSAI